MAIIIVAISRSCSNNTFGLNRKVSAYVMAEGFVNDRLKSPASAKYPDYDESFVQTDGDTYTVSAYVDSQNGFGATLRTKWTAVLHDAGGDKWTCQQVRLGGD